MKNIVNEVKLLEGRKLILTYHYKHVMSSKLKFMSMITKFTKMNESLSFIEAIFL